MENNEFNRLSIEGQLAYCAQLRAQFGDVRDIVNALDSTLGNLSFQLVGGELEEPDTLHRARVMLCEVSILLRVTQEDIG